MADFSPLITFKAGRCEANGRKVQPVAAPGYLYLFEEDELIHLCWRPRNAPAREPEVDLITVPGDASFQPLVKDQGADEVRSPTNGRIFCLSFSSGGEKHYFWMQSKSQHREGDTNWFSQRDQRLGQIVDMLLSGEDVNVEREVEEMRRDGRGGGGDGGDHGGEADEDEDLMDLDRQETGGAGADATGGDTRDEGETSREGGADGGRAVSSSQPQDTSAIVQNFLNSLKGSSAAASTPSQAPSDIPSTTLPDLLATATTISYIESASAAQIDHLCSLLPADLFLLSQEGTSSILGAEPSSATVSAAIEALSRDQKNHILERVLRSPQLRQSLGSLTVALRDGGLPMIGEALRLNVENGGLIRRGSLPLGGGHAVEAFIDGVKRTVENDEADDGTGQKK